MNSNGINSAIISLAIALGLVLIGFLIGFPIGASIRESSIRTEAIKNHAAHYTVNPETGAVKFVWNTSEEESGDAKDM